MPPAIQALLDRIGGTRRAMIIGVGVLAAAAIFGVSKVAGAPEWVPAFQGLPIESVGKMTEVLDQSGVQYRLERGGQDVLVPAPDLARARVALAKGGGMPATGRPGLELFDQPSWGMTDFTQRINYRRALEGELERTIGKMRGVEVAQVHLALRETASFRRGTEKPAAASVVLKLKTGETPERDVVDGIAHLVASSVDGIDAERVTVLDEAGRMLSTPDDAGSLAGLTNRQLAVQREVENYLAQKAEQMVAQMVGPGNARVQVAAAINFDKIERTTEQVDPDKQALATEQRAEITPGAEGGAASSNMATSYENSKSVETFSGAIGNVRRLTVAVLLNDRPPVPPGASDSAIKAIAALPARTLPLAQVQLLVSGAVGLDSARGDVISVVSVPFEAPMIAAEPQPTSSQKLLDTVQQVQRPALSALGLLLVFVLALTAMKSLKPKDAPATATLASGQPQYALAGGMPSASAQLADVTYAPAIAAAPVAPPEPIVIPTSPQRERVVAAVDQHPDVAAKLLRSWLKEA